MNSGSSPQRIRLAHSPDEFLDFRIDSRATDTTAAFPSPIQAETLAVPCDYCFGLHNDQHRTPMTPETGKANPQPPIGRTQFGSVYTSVEHIELMTKCEDFDFQLAAASETES